MARLSLDFFRIWRATEPSSGITPRIRSAVKSRQLASETSPRLIRATGPSLTRDSGPSLMRDNGPSPICTRRLLCAHRFAAAGAVQNHRDGEFVRVGV